MSKYAPGYTGPTTTAGPRTPRRPKGVAPKGTGPADGNPRTPRPALSKAMGMAKGGMAAKKAKAGTSYKGGKK